MEYYDIIRKTIDVYTACTIHNFPLNCFEIIRSYGYKVYTYTYIEDKFPKLYEHCRNYSNDSFKFSAFKFVIYNDKCNTGRVLFSLAHELGHIVCGHDEESLEYEDIANTFAGYLLAPCVMIDHYNCQSFEDVMNHFGLSITAANIAWQNYRRWKRHAPYAEDMDLLNWILYLRKPLEVTDENMYLVNPFESLLENDQSSEPPKAADSAPDCSDTDKKSLETAKDPFPPLPLVGASPLPPRDPDHSEKMKLYYQKKRMQRQKELEQVERDMEDLDRAGVDFVRTNESHWLYR